MIKKFEYTFRAKTPIHTGSDEKSGTLKMLRRQKIIQKKPTTYVSKLSEDMRIKVIVLILLGVWNSIKFDDIKGYRLLNIWEEFHNKLIAATRSNSKIGFIQNITNSWGISKIALKDGLELLDILNDDEMINTIRDSSMYLIMYMRQVKEECKDDDNKGYYYNLKDIMQGENVIVTKNDIMMPCITGNSIRGKMRRLVMADFLKNIELSEIDKKTYHVFFTGGILDSSTLNIDVDKMDMYVKNNPMLCILGSAIGNMIIEGMMNVGFAYPKCLEMDNGVDSVWCCLDTIFQTRNDTSKTESTISIKSTNENVKKQKSAIQMKYEYEVFAPGTEFKHQIALKTTNPLYVSAFWKLVELYKENGTICGMSAIGNGEIEFIGLEIPKDGSNLYMDYLKNNKVKLKEFWKNEKL